MNDVGFRDCLTLTEESGTQTFAGGEVRGSESLEGFCVANCDEVCLSNLGNDGDIGGEVEMQH